MEQTDFLEDPTVDHYPADKGLRFLNYIIDVVVFYIFAFLLGIVLAFVAPNFITNQDLGNQLLLNLFFLAFYVLYYGIMEGATNGKTIGKYISKTRVVKQDGTPLTYSDTFKRAFSRIVPFEPFSALGDAPWHDRWTDTLVIKESKQ